MTRPPAAATFAAPPAFTASARSGSRSHPSTSVIAAVWTTRSAPASRLGDRGRVGHVELGPGEERRLGQVGAQGEADLAARARYENVGTSSQSSPGFWASRSLTTGSASICHGIASVGSFQATPCSSLGSYSPVTQ